MKLYVIGVACIIGLITLQASGVVINLPDDQFREFLKSKGIPDEQIHKYLNSKGIPDEQIHGKQIIHDDEYLKSMEMYIKSKLESLNEYLKSKGIGKQITDEDKYRKTLEIYLRPKLDSLNKYLKSKGVNKQFTEEEFYGMLFDKDSDIHIIHNKPTTQPVKKDNQTHHTQKNPTTQPVKKDDHKEQEKKNPTTQPVKKDDHKEHQQSSTIERRLPKRNNNETLVGPFSLSNILFFNKPFVPLWIIKKFFQILGHLLDDNYAELEAPTHYYDASI
ncbi:unnamed protein product [Schistosoma turkestanicum]|nr:unnamed protein product [Schistosoma turkestanicum]